MSWQFLGLYDYGDAHWFLIAVAVGLSLVGVVHVRLAGRLDAAASSCGSSGSIRRAPRPRSWRRSWTSPALVIYFTVAFAVLRGTLL